jgi:hypothetical protein
LSKQKSSLKYIFKINSSRIRSANWNLNLSSSEAFKNEEIVSLADSTTLRFIRNIKGLNDDEIENQVKVTKKQIKILKSYPTTPEHRKNIRKQYDLLFDLTFVKDYICIVMDSNKDFDRLNSKKGFYINGVKFKRLLATTGGAKNSTVVYVSDLIHSELNIRLENGRDASKPFVPAKLEAYKSLACSASVTVPNPTGILVVNDCVTNFTSDIVKIDDTYGEYPSMTYEKDSIVELNDSDGYGLILPSLSKHWAEFLGEDYTPSGYCLRGSFTKGMVFSFDFLDFANKISGTTKVIDAWGNMKDLIDDQIQLILTTSMLKLWDSYNNIEHYLRCCDENGYEWSVTKVIPKQLENERNLNYQFIQSLNLSDNDIDELIEPTITEIKDVLSEDWRKSLLFLKGSHLHDKSFTQSDSDFSKALMVDKEMIKDPFVRTRIHNMTKKRINDAKTGVLRVKGNFSIVSGDPYSLCQSIFGMEVTGLLKAGEFYSNYWNEKNIDKVACFRAPMTCHNNIRILRFKNTEVMNYWYQYMSTVTIFNSWDTTAHALNGLDKDGDSVMTTPSPVILRAIRELEAILCVQKTANKIIATEDDFIKANKNSFGDAIGSITNRITSMFDVQAKYDRASEEYKELEYRIICGQNYQQNAIDKSKGIVSKAMPKDWYDYKSNMPSNDEEEDINEQRDFNISILADKKPYFFSYIYPHLMKQHRLYIANTTKNAYKRFDLSVEELIAKEGKNEDEENFLKFYHYKTPLSMADSVMNNICRKIEGEFDNVRVTLKKVEFDHTILMSNATYTKGRFAAIKELYKQYLTQVREYVKSSKSMKIDKDERQSKRAEFVESFKKEASMLCNCIEELTNIVVEVCYSNGSDNSKQFAWDICGEQMIKNLLKRNNNTIHYPVLDSLGDIEFGGEKFKLVSNVLEDCDIESSFK